MTPVERFHSRVEHPVDAVLDRDAALVGFDVDVARALGEGIEQQRVDQPHHRARHVAELLQRNGFLPALLGLLHHHEAEILGDALEHLRRSLGALERGLNGSGAREEQVHAQSGEVLEPVRQGEIVGIGDRHLDCGSVEAVGNRAERIGLGCRQAPEQLGRHAEIVQIHEGQSELSGERLGELLGGDRALAHQALAKLHLGFLGRNLPLVDKAPLEENLGQRARLERMLHLMMSAMWNTGRYMTMMMPPMRSPISSISSGSTSAMTRARRLSSTSS